MSSPVKAVAPFTFETNRPRYLVILERSPAELVNEVGPPQLVEILENVPVLPDDESCRTRTAECVKVVLTHTFRVAVVELRLVKTGRRLYGVE